MKKYEKYDCEIILNNYTNTLIRYNKFFEKGCVTTSCKRRKEEFIVNLQILEKMIINCNENY